MPGTRSAARHGVKGLSEVSKPFALVIFSHSSYTDVWPCLLESYEKNFDTEVFDCFITSDNPDDAAMLDHSSFKLIQYDDQLSWTDAFVQSIRDLPHEKFLFSFDDLLIKKHVDKRRLRRALEFDCYDYLKVICSHVRLYDRVFRRGEYFDVKSNDSYRGSLVFSIFSRGLLDFVTAHPDLHGLSAWQYERKINSVLNDDFRYGCVRHNIVRFENLIIKGRVNPVSRLKLRLLTGLVYKGARPDQSLVATVSYHSKLLVFTLIKYVMPPSWFAGFRRAKQRAIQVFGDV